MGPPNIAIIHFHLNRGGVTQVIVNQLRALDQVGSGNASSQVAILFGGRRDGFPDTVVSEFTSLNVSLQTIPELDYDDGVTCHDEALAVAITHRLDQVGFNAADTLLHVHNHALGKNVSMPGALARIAGNGYALLLQIHDFAEDFRPDNYKQFAKALTQGVHEDLSALLYPQANQIHYAVLNRRDLLVLQQAGVVEERLHLLPNPVNGFSELPDKAIARKKLADRFGVPPDKKYVLYPVRGIRRKNIGEALLWAALIGDDTTFAVTLPPINPIELQSYNAWKRLTEQSRIACLFDVGADCGLTFPENLSAADLILTTSVAEGFGMVFLESWLASRKLIGRNLPEITADFVDHGVRFKDLQSKILVPINWVGIKSLQSTLRKSLERALALYGQRSVTDKEFDAQFEQLVEDDCVDFAILSSPLQAQVIERSNGDNPGRDQLLDLNPWMTEALTLRESDELLIQANAAAVVSAYSLQVSGVRLRELYKQVLESPRNGKTAGLPNGDQILSSFLKLSRLHPIRMET